MAENEMTASNGPKSEGDLVALVDVTTRERIGSLSAHGVSDHAIAEILLLEPEVVTACRNTDEFKKKYAEIATDEINKQIDLDEGWDAVETAGITQVLETLKYNRDPKFALAAAAMANKAARKKNTSNRQPHVLDAGSRTSNIIVLNMNRTFVNSVTQDGNRTLNVESKTIDLEVKKRTDLPSPKHVNEMLGPVRTASEKKMTEMEEMFAAAGVVFDQNE